MLDSLCNPCGLLHYQLHILRRIDAFLPFPMRMDVASNLLLRDGRGEALSAPSQGSGHIRDVAKPGAEAKIV